MIQVNHLLQLAAQPGSVRRGSYHDFFLAVKRFRELLLLTTVLESLAGER